VFHFPVMSNPLTGVALKHLQIRLWKDKAEAAYYFKAPYGRELLENFNQLYDEYDNAEFDTYDEWINTFHAEVQDLFEQYSATLKAQNLAHYSLKTAKGEVLNPITYKYKPDELSPRYIDWLMQRKRRILTEGKIGKRQFAFEMSELAKLRRKAIIKDRNF